jgi:hypothetical protein
VLSRGRCLRLARLDMALVFLESGVYDFPACPLYTLPHSQGMLYVPRELRFRSLAGQSRWTERQANRRTGMTKLIVVFLMCFENAYNNEILNSNRSISRHVKWCQCLINLTLLS